MSKSFERRLDEAFGMPEGRINQPGFETELITMDPAEAQAWVERFPGHGNKEAQNKISDIMTYGPDYGSASGRRATRIAELEALAKYWDLDLDAVRSGLKWYPEYAPEHKEKFEQFFIQNAHLFGGGQPELPPEPEVPPIPV